MRSRFAAVWLLVAAFLVGGVAGALGYNTIQHRRAPRRGGREGYVERLSAQLDLSGAQQDSIRAVLTRHEPVMDSLWREVRPRFDSLRTDLRNQIRGQLTPEQQQRYDDMLERRDRQYRTRRNNARQ